MADIRDPEKDLHQSSSTSSTIPVADSDRALEKEMSIHEASPHSSISISTRHSHDSQSIDSDHSDPLAALEHAMSRNQDFGVEEYMPKTYITRTATSIGTFGSRAPDFEVDFEADDPENPRNWPLWYRSMVIASVSYGTWVVVCYSTSYTSAMPGMMIEFGIESEAIATLGVTAYLFGLAIGALIFAPLSEIYGRRPVYAVALLLFTVLVLPCALAHSMVEIIVVRFFGYVFV